MFIYLFVSICTVHVRIVIQILIIMPNSFFVFKIRFIFVKFLQLSCYCIYDSRHLRELQMPFCKVLLKSFSEVFFVAEKISSKLRRDLDECRILCVQYLQILNAGGKNDVAYKVSKFYPRIQQALSHEYFFLGSRKYFYFF